MSAKEWAPEAQPHSREQLAGAPLCPAVVDAAKGRGITSIVHFTRITGLVGMLDTSVVMARSELEQEERLRFVYRENAPDRDRDRPWHSYVNLSISTINVLMFRYSKRWHPREDWVILEFDPGILGHRGVVFCTTNNAYRVAHRATGLRGFEQLFAARVPWGRRGSVSTRGSRQLDQTTNPQAEVLYPFELSLEHLHSVTVASDHAHDAVEGALSHFPHGPMIVPSPEAFR